MECGNDSVVTVIMDASISYSSLLFTIITIPLHCSILFVLFFQKSNFYFTNFFYVLYSIGSVVDIISLISNHIGAMFPAREWFLPFYISSLLPGRIFLFFSWGVHAFQGVTAVIIATNRVIAVLFPFKHGKIWSNRGVQFLCLFLPLTMWIYIGMNASTREVYWYKYPCGGWYIQFHVTEETRHFFIRTYISMTGSMIYLFSCHVLIINAFKSQRKNSNALGIHTCSDSTIRRSSNTNRQELSLLYIAIVVCSMEFIYYLTFGYVFVLIDDFSVNSYYPPLHQAPLFQFDMRSFYLIQFILNDLYSGLPPYLLIIFSRGIRKDILRLLRSKINKKLHKISHLDTSTTK